MQITISDDWQSERPRHGPITVGWLRANEKAGILYDPPERVTFRQTNRTHAKSAARCPAVIQLESRYFMIRAPFDLHLGFQRDDKGRPQLVNRGGAASAVRGSKMGEVLSLVAEAEWRYPDRPTIQLHLPYIFVADEPVYISQLDAFAHYRRQPLPGTIFGGRFPITNWPRPLMWAFEWHEPEKDIQITRGDPLFYIQFEGEGPERPIQLVEVERTAELLAFIEHVAGAVNFVNQTFSLFKAAEAARPPKLVKPKGGA